MVLVSIIILSYNTPDLLKSCLASIYKYVPHELFELIVVDNASTDGSVAMVREQFPRVRLITSDTNRGFGRGMNLGAQQAKGEYILLFNSDAKFTKNVLNDMVAYAKEHPKVGIVGGLLENVDGTPQRSFGKFYNLPQVFLMLMSGDKGEMRLLNGKSQVNPFAVDWVSGGFMLIRRDLFERIHGFDRNFFMYIEDMELCYRIKKAGYSIHIFPKATAVHASQGSSNRSFAIQHIYKGLLYFYKKHKTPLEYSILKSMLILKALVLITIGTITQNKYLTTTYKHALRG